MIIVIYCDIKKILYKKNVKVIKIIKIKDLI